jgi:hypothetical protein
VGLEGRGGAHHAPFDTPALPATQGDELGGSQKNFVMLSSGPEGPRIEARSGLSTAVAPFDTPALLATQGDELGGSQKTSSC